MKEFERDAVLLQALVSKYGIGDPVPQGLPEHILDSKERVFRRVLRSAGRYGTLFAALSAFYFLLRRKGIPLWAVKAASAAGAAALIAAGTYYSLGRGPARHAVPEDTRPADTLVLEERSVTNGNREGRERVLVRTLSILPFEGHGMERILLDRATRVFESEILSRMGNDYAAVPSGGTKVRARYSLTGSIERVGDGYLLFVKVVDMQSSRLLFHGRERMDSTDDVDASCARLAQKLPVLSE